MHGASPHPLSGLHPTTILLSFALACLAFASATPPEPTRCNSPAADLMEPSTYVTVPVTLVEVEPEFVFDSDPEPLPMRETVGGRDPFAAPTMVNP
ncbi:MAG: hypothetical protein ACJAYU_001708 [Bradymonadia bacterium]|jgi:hypothetical protein